MEKELQSANDQNEKSNEIEQELREQRKENDELKLELSNLRKEISNYQYKLTNTSKTEQKLQEYQKQNVAYSKDIQRKQYVKNKQEICQEFFC